MRKYLCGCVFVLWGPNRCVVCINVNVRNVMISIFTVKPITLHDLSQVIEALDGVRNIRGLALQLGLLHDDRNGLDNFMNPTDRKIELIKLWITHDVDCSWQRLLEALLAPQLLCLRAAERISVFLSSGTLPHLVNQESGDSVLCVSSSPYAARGLESLSLNFNMELSTSMFTMLDMFITVII